METNFDSTVTWERAACFTSSNQALLWYAIQGWLKSKRWGGNTFQSSKRETWTIRKRKYSMLTAENRLGNSSASKRWNVLIWWNCFRGFLGSNCRKRWPKSAFWQRSSFCETLANQNGIVSMAAPFSNQKLNGFKEILNLLPEAERKGLMKAVCDFCLAKNATFSKRRNKDLPLNTIYVVGKERFFLYVEGASSVRND